jgi:tRNA threonylcarbamoyladenosine biosynthesis protein TsaE
MKKNKPHSPIIIPNEKAMFQFAAKLMTRLKPSDVIFLTGNLGAGKTTLVRGCLRALGYDGVVKSPTYTLVETYSIDHHVIHHFDLYRLNSPLELEHLGVDYYFTPKNICFIEWPEKASELLPQPTYQISIKINGPGRIISQMR